MMIITIHSYAGEGATTVSQMLARLLESKGVEVVIEDQDGEGAPKHSLEQLDANLEAMGVKGVKVQITQHAAHRTGVSDGQS